MRTLDLREHADGRCKEVGGYVENWMERENRVLNMIEKYDKKGRWRERNGRVPRKVKASDGSTYESVSVAAGVLRCSESMVRQAIKNETSVRGVYLTYVEESPK
jgi:hypothetical protein